MFSKTTLNRVSEKARAALMRWSWLRPLLGRASLWRWSRRRVATGAAVGVFFGLLIPVGQIPAAAFAAAFLRANLPAAAIATFITNPLTTAAVYYGMYHLGHWLMGLFGNVAPSGTDLLDQAGEVGSSLLIGVPISAIVLAALTYVAVNMFWLIWAARRRWGLWLRAREFVRVRRLARGLARRRP